jgi:hypothetical protein
MNGGSCRIGSGKQFDHSPDLPPSAKMDDITEPAAAASARRRLACGKIAKLRDQIRGIGRRRRIGEIDALVQGFPHILLSLRLL